MKNTQITIVFFLLLLFISSLLSCSHVQGSVEDKNEGLTVITGQIFNYDPEDLYVNFIANEFLTSPKSTYGAKLDENGRFEVSFNMIKPQEIYIEYGRLLKSIICIPKDSLNIEIYLKKQDENNDIGQSMIFTAGKAKDINNQYVNYQESLSKIEEPYTCASTMNAVKSKSPEEYKAYIEDRNRLFYAHLEDFKEINTIDNLLNNFILDQIKYNSFNNLLRYRWHNPLLNDKNDDLILPLEYYGYSKNDLKDFDLITKAHLIFLNEYNNLILNDTVNDKNVLKARNLVEKGLLIEAFSYLPKIISNNSDGFTKDYLLTSLHLDLLKEITLAEFDKIYSQNTVNNHFLERQINDEYKRQKKILNNESLSIPDINLQTLETSNIIYEIATKYKGSVIYLDFWAPSCGPCMKEMPHSKILEDELKDENIVFVYLGVEVKESSWKSTIADKDIKGEHLLLTKDQYSEAKNLLGIDGIPHYTIIDKNGNILMKNAPRPSDKIKLLEIFNSIM